MNVYDVAKKAKVSTATISRVLNNSGSVKPATRERVMRTLEECNYTVNDVARSLAMNSTKTVAMLSTDIREYYYSQIAYTIEQGLAQKGYYSFFCNTGFQPERQIDYINAMLSKRVCAIVIIGSSSRNEALLSTIIKASRSVPVVMTNFNIPSENIFCIERDDAAGIRFCVDHMISTGCKRLALLCDYHYASDTVKRLVFEDYISRYAGVSITGDVLSCGIGPSSSLESADSLMDGGLKYDGIVCTNDGIAAGLIKGFSMRGVRIPEDIKITGYDNTELACLTSPSITSVDSEIVKQGEIVNNILLGIMESNVKPGNHMLITPTLIKRESA